MSRRVSSESHTPHGGRVQRLAGTWSIVTGGLLWQLPSLSLLPVGADATDTQPAVLPAL